MITLNELSKTYLTAQGEVTALKSLNLQIKQGEIYGIIGKSGAGKSTLIRCVNLLERPTQGRVIVSGEDLTQLSIPALRAARRNIGMIFQHFNLLSSRTVFENIALPLELMGYSSQKMKGTINPLLELTGLANKKENYPSQLSGGQKQRVAIARALASQPNVLLSDEATSALDPETTIQILDLLKNIRDQLNLTILLITHEMSVIKACCDRVGILEHGSLVEENDVGEFFTRPKTDVAKNFITSSSMQELPSLISQALLVCEQPQSHPVWRLRFWEETVTQPVISQLINRFKLKLNILQANVDYIKNHILGIMIVAVDGDKTQLANAVNYLKDLNIQVEVIGYVPNDIIPFA